MSTSEETDEIMKSAEKQAEKRIRKRKKNFSDISTSAEGSDMDSGSYTHACTHTIFTKIQFLLHILR